jgi:hypothetical protein
MRSTPAGAVAPAVRYASRSRRRARLRATAPRICRLTANPTRQGPPVSRQTITSDGRAIRAPPRNTSWKSRFPRSRSVRSPFAERERDTALHGEPLSPLRSPALEDAAAPRTPHALAKPMRLLPPALVRLECPLHGRSSPSGYNPRTIRARAAQVNAGRPAANPPCLDVYGCATLHWQHDSDPS